MTSLVRVYVDFTNNPTALNADAVWTEVTQFVKTVSGNRGRNQELDHFQAGQYTIVFKNTGGNFNPPTFDDGVTNFGDVLVPNRRVKVEATDGNAPIFDGYADSWKLSFDQGGFLGICTLTCTDAFKVLARQENLKTPFETDALKLVVPPYFWWRLGEAAGSTSVTDRIQGANLSVFGDVILGEPGLILLDDDTAALWPTDSFNASRLDSRTVQLPYTGNQRLQIKQDGTPSANQSSVSSNVAVSAFPGSFDVRMRLLWTPQTVGENYLIGDGGFTGNAGWYIMQVGTQLEVSFTGSTGTVARATALALPSSLNGQVVWIAVTSENLSGNLWTTKFYYNTAASPAADVTTWVNVNGPGGSAVLDLGSGTMQSTPTVSISIGSRGRQGTSESNSYSNVQTDIYNAQVRTSLNGTVACSPDFTTAPWSAGDTTGASHVDAQGITWTIRTPAGKVAPAIVGATQPFTFSTFVHVGDSTDWTGRVLFKVGTQAIYWALNFAADLSPQFIVDRNGTPATLIGPALIEGNTYHLVCVYDSAGNMTMWINGVLVPSITNATRQIDQPGVVIGNTTSDSLRSFVGTIDEVMLWNVALDATSIQTIYNTAFFGWAGDTSDVRIGRVLDSIAWPSDRRDLDVGLETLQAATLSSDALSYTQLVADSDLFGSLFMKADGDIAFRNRANLFDQTLTADEPTFMDIDVDYNDTLLRNNVTIQRVNGVPHNRQDPASIAQYFNLDYSRSDLIHDNDSHSGPAAQLIIDNYAQPTQRINSLTINVRSGDPGDLCSWELGDWIRILALPKPLVEGLVLDVTCAIESIRHDVTEGSLVWTMVVGLSPALTTTSMLGYGRLDSRSATLNTTVLAGVSSIKSNITGALWTATDVPFGITVDGESMVVTAVTGASSPQTFTLQSPTVAGHTAAAQIRISSFNSNPLDQPIVLA